MEDVPVPPPAPATPPPPPAPVAPTAPQSVVAPPPVTPPVVPPPVAAAPPRPAAPPSTKAANPAIIAPRRSSPIKKILIFLFVLILLGIIALAATKFLGSRSPSGPVTLTYWGLWEPEAVMRPVLDEFESSHPTIKVDYKMQSLSEYRERLSSALSQNKGPDIMRIHASWLPMYLSNLSPVPATAISASEYEATFYPVAKNFLRLNGNYYGVPLMYDGLMMYTNDDLFAQSNLSAPKTWDELRIAALSMSKCGTETGTCVPGARVDVSGVAMGTTNNVDHWQDLISILLLQNGVNLAIPTGQAADDVFAYYANFTKNFGIWNKDLPSSTQQFASGKLAVYFAPSWRVFDLKAMNPTLRFSVHPIPQLPVDPARGEAAVEWATFWVEGVNNKSAHTAQAWELVKYLSSAEVQQKLYAAAQSNGRLFGEPYARVDLAAGLKNDPFLAPLMNAAPIAKTWYLVSSTQDGEKGLNTQLSTAFAMAAQEGVSGELSKNVSAILSTYGLTGAAAQ